MSQSNLVAAIEAEWEPTTGFLWKARQGQFDVVGLERVLNTLRSMAIDENAQVPRRLVSILWYMPLFLHWQIERVREAGGNVVSYTQAAASITNEIERLLGTP